MTYTPNFEDPRVVKKIKRVIGFAYSQLSENKPKELSKKYLDSVFGQQQNLLSKYLREQVMITTNNFFRFNSSAKSQCKWYQRNTDGLNELMSKVDVDVEQILYKMSNLSYSYCITSLDEAKKTALALEFAREEYGGMLKTGNIQYKDKANRYWGGTQGLRKEIKRQLHFEHNYLYEYDINAAAPTLLYQLAQRQKCKKLEHIEFYLEHKQEVRTTLSENLNIPIKDIKEVINALFAGARFDHSIAKVITNRTKLNALQSNKFVQDLRNDISLMWKAIKPTIGERWNKKMQVEKKISSSTKWSVYFKLEREVIDVVIDHLKDIRCSKYVLEHDGWTTSLRLNKEEVEELIKSKTGYVIKIDEEVLTGMELIACV